MLAESIQDVAGNDELQKNLIMSLPIFKMARIKRSDFPCG